MNKPAKQLRKLIKSIAGSSIADEGLSQKPGNRMRLAEASPPNHGAEAQSEAQSTSAGWAVSSPA